MISHQFLSLIKESSKEDVGGVGTVAETKLVPWISEVLESPREMPGACEKQIDASFVEQIIFM